MEASALTFCFELVCRGTLAEGCELHIAEQQAECWCESCQQYVHLMNLLQNYLLGRLRGDAREIFGDELFGDYLSFLQNVGI